MSTAIKTDEELFAELATLTGMSAGEWSDFVSCTPEQQEFLAKGYRDLDWTQHADTFDQVMVVLGVVGTVAGVITGVAGAASAIKALKTME